MSTPKTSAGSSFAPEYGLDGVELALPDCRRGIGQAILAPDARDLIAGVRVEPCAIWPDDRGYFLEAVRSSVGLAANFAKDTTQFSLALSYPGTIKAFHYHREQTDLWVPAMGMFQVALVDLRRKSAAFGMRNTMYVGTMRCWRILIPPGVGHGYKIVGDAPAMLAYATDRFYNPDDEGRIPYDEPHIAYDWGTQHK